MARLSRIAKRTSLGLAAMLALLALFEVIPRPWSAYAPREGFIDFGLWPDLWSMFGVAIATAIGAYVAREKFIIPAVLVILAIAIVGTFHAQSISDIAEAMGFYEIFARNLFSFVFAIVGAVVGAIIGERLSRLSRNSKGHAV